MPRPAITIEALPAGYGDALLVTCARRRGVWTALIDTGPDECWPLLAARLAGLPRNRRGERVIDLAVISHIDHDHIGGAAALFSDTALRLRFADVWFNAPRQAVARGVAEGEALATILGANPVALPWNRAWSGQWAVTPADTPYVELPGDADRPRITLLSPSPARLQSLFRRWTKELAALRSWQAPVIAATPRGVTSLDLETLAKKVTAVDRAVANGSSIAFLLEHRGASVLLLADAHPTVVLPALRALAAARGQPLPWRLDTIKLSHHGSRANTTADLLRVVQADHYIVSTNGVIFGHPDDEAIARAVVLGGRDAKLWFNYRTERTAKWTKAGLLAGYGCEPVWPTESAGGVAIDLRGRR
jgi:beta-lactamase superfamily II metal-dependent hydrolase